MKLRSMHLPIYFRIRACLCAIYQHAICAEGSAFSLGLCVFVSPLIDNSPLEHLENSQRRIKLVRFHFIAELWNLYSYWCISSLKVYVLLGLPRISHFCHFIKTTF